MLKISTVFRNLNKLNKNFFHSSATLNGTQFYPINDDVFGLNDDQKEVKLCNIFVFLIHLIELVYIYS